jgi:hypothetical protein
VRHVAEGGGRVLLDLPRIGHQLLRKTQFGQSKGWKVTEWVPADACVRACARACERVCARASVTVDTKGGGYRA